MKELVEVIAKSLVDFPDEVVVTETESEKGTIVELRVAQSDMVSRDVSPRQFVLWLRQQLPKKTRRLL